VNQADAMKKDCVVFHFDCDSFFASVEETFHPEYKDVLMAVAGDPISTPLGIAKQEKA
jgi:nucleotidyltransferase/DNA polymerase involved in DNA repair